jgi:hypothetical protein
VNICLVDGSGESRRPVIDGIIGWVLEKNRPRKETGSLSETQAEAQDLTITVSLYPGIAAKTHTVSRKIFQEGHSLLGMPVKRKTQGK